MGNFRERRVDENGLIAIRDVSPMFVDNARSEGLGRGKGFRIFAFPANKDRIQLWNSIVDR